MRMLMKSARKYNKNGEIKQKIGQYFLKGVNYYFGYWVNNENYGKFQELVKFCRDVKLPIPSLEKVNSKDLGLYLGGEVDGEFQKMLVEKINN